jgi:hypothetical protein
VILECDNGINIANPSGTIFLIPVFCMHVKEFAWGKCRGKAILWRLVVPELHLSYEAENVISTFQVNLQMLALIADTLCQQEERQAMKGERSRCLLLL